MCARGIADAFETRDVPCSLFVLPVGREENDDGGRGCVFDADDLVALSIAAGTSPSMYFDDDDEAAGGRDDRSMEPLALVVVVVASDDELDC